MSMLGVILMIAAGLAIMAFGLLLFYAWLPLFYGLFGLEIGLRLGHTLTGQLGLMAIILGVVGAVVLFSAAYALEPYRRILLGLSAGALIGLSIASVLGLQGYISDILGVALALVGAVIGAIIVPKYFDTFVVVVSAFCGAAMVMAGAHLLFPELGVFDRSAGSFMQPLITLALTAVGISWQYKNLSAWVESKPLYGNISGRSVKDQVPHSRFP